MALGTVNVGQSQVDGSNYLTQEQVGVSGGLATLDANGKLTVSQRPDFEGYTKDETDDKVSGAVTTHNGS